MMQSIQLLPEHLIDQIKAGEVIEKPAQVLKELVENSIDAQATSIEITIINNGLDLIEVKDNGSGIPHEQMPLAFARHTTSKLRNFSDLRSIKSYGFRGEALPSIASVSKVKCLSKTKKNKQAFHFEIHGGQVHLHTPTDNFSFENGTKISIKNLFYNTPVRLDFLNNKRSEKNSIQRMISQFILSNPQIEWIIHLDEQDKEKFTPTSIEEDCYKERISKVLKLDSLYDIQLIDKSYDSKRVKLFYSSNLTRKRNKPFIFVNKRPIEDIKLQSIIKNSLERNFGTHLHYSFIVFLEIPNEEIEINVHPTKSKIKFHRDSKLFSFIYSSIEQSKEKNRRSLTPTPNSEDIQQAQFDFNLPKDLKSKPSSNTASPFINRSSLQQEKYYASSEQVLGSFLIRKKDEQLEVLDLKKLQDIFIDQALLTRNEISPLLVAHRLPNKDLDNINFFNKMGIEAKEVNDDFIIIRSLPSILLKINFIKFLNSLNEEISNELDQKEVLSRLSLFIEAHQVPKVEELLLSINPNNKKYKRSLTTNDLKKLFK